MLKVVHINKEATQFEANARALAEILRPKWEAKKIADGKKFFKKHGIIIPDDEPVKQKA